MDKESHNNHDNGTSSNNNIGSVRDRDKSGGGDGSGSLLLRASSDGIRQSTASDLVPQWGNRKRLRCMKVQVKHDTTSNPVQKTTVRVDRRVVRTEKDSSNRLIASVTDNNNNNSHNNNNNQNQSNGYPNLRQRPPSPQQPPPRILRSSRTSHPN